MKCKIFTIVSIFLIVSSCLNVVCANITDETPTNITGIQQDSTKEIKDDETKRIGKTVHATSDGYQNITFDDGYNGYCANKYLKDADAGDTFIVQDTSKLVNPKYNESVGNYLKILFVDHYDYVMQSKLNATLAVWEFTDNPYKTDSYLEIVQSILKEAQDGRIIPDHGEIKKINNTTEAIFDFECLQSTDDKTQNFFGYKITFREILTGIMGNAGADETLEKNETTENNEPQENNQTLTNNQTTENNKTLTNNQTTENNNTTTKTENNETQKNNQTTENNNTPENNMTSPNNNNNSSKVMTNVDNGNLEKEDNNQSPINIIKHTTGNSAAIGLGLLLFLTIFLIIKYKRD